MSKIIWAPLKKSPNWASQIGSSFGCAILIPYSKPSTASSDSALLHTWNNKTHKKKPTHMCQQSDDFTSILKQVVQNGYNYWILKKLLLGWFFWRLTDLQVAFLLRMNVIQGDVHLISLLAHNHCMTLAKCTTSHILATDPHVKACIEQTNKQ